MSLLGSYRHLLDRLVPNLLQGMSISKARAVLKMIWLRGGTERCYQKMTTTRMTIEEREGKEEHPELSIAGTEGHCTLERHLQP